MKYKIEQYKEYSDAFLSVFPDSKNIPRMADVDIDIMVLQEWLINHGMTLSSFYKIIELCMVHPELDREVFFKGCAAMINDHTRGKNEVDIT